MITEKYLIKLYKDFIKIFNEYNFNDIKNSEYYINIYHNLTNLLLYNNIIEEYNFKHYRVVKTKEII